MKDARILPKFHGRVISFDLFLALPQSLSADAGAVASEGRGLAAVACDGEDRCPAGAGEGLQRRPGTDLPRLQKIPQFVVAGEVQEKK